MPVQRFNLKQYLEIDNSMEGNTACFFNHAMTKEFLCQRHLL